MQRDRSSSLWEELFTGNMRPQSAKAKGRRLQQMVRDSILSRFPVLTQDDVRSTSMRAGGEDVQLSSQARRLFPYSIEAKNQERLNVWASLDQAKSNAPPGCTPLLVMKRNNDPIRVVLPWDTFLDLVAPTEEGETRADTEERKKEEGTDEKADTEERKKEEGTETMGVTDKRRGREEEEWVKSVRQRAEEILRLCDGGCTRVVVETTEHT